MIITLKIITKSLKSPYLSKGHIIIIKHAMNVTYDNDENRKLTTFSFKARSENLCTVKYIDSIKDPNR